MIYKRYPINFAVAGAMREKRVQGLGQCSLIALTCYRELLDCSIVGRAMKMNNKYIIINYMKFLKVFMGRKEAPLVLFLFFVGGFIWPFFVFASPSRAIWLALSLYFIWLLVVVVQVFRVYMSRNNTEREEL